MISRKTPLAGRVGVCREGRGPGGGHEYLICSRDILNTRTIAWLVFACGICVIDFMMSNTISCTYYNCIS